jgi:hypothetical protein
VRILLLFAPEQSSIHRARIGYAFRVFCSLYEHRPLFERRDDESPDVCISYSPREVPSGVPAVFLSNLYTPRSPSELPPPPSILRTGESTTVLRFQPAAGATPDWLAETFEWISCADEYSVTTRDAIGRVPFAASYFGRYGIDPAVPHASRAMDQLDEQVWDTVGRRSVRGSIKRPGQVIINTHDVDYLPGSYLANQKRLWKNAAVSIYHHRRPALACRQAGMALRQALGGPNPLDQMLSLIDAESGRDITATYFILVRNLHRRDGNYDISSARVLDLLRLLGRSSMEVAVHGSYTSNETRRGLSEEFELLTRSGFRPSGNRQHWLRFRLEQLIPAVEQAGAAYDSSIGWSDQIGFRAGASFAFPPYHFGEERPATFLEIPLAVMDQSVMRIPGGESEWFASLSRLLTVSRSYPSAAISMLWHPTAFGGAQLPLAVGDLFWRLADMRKQWKDAWLSAADFVAAKCSIYTDVGLKLNSLGPLGKIA